jgi:hypothetical protein
MFEAFKYRIKGTSDNNQLPRFIVEKADVVALPIRDISSYLITT